MCPCRCEHRRKLEYWASQILPNYTKEELQKVLEPTLERIRQELKVNKTNLSSNLRKLTSAQDKRPSSGAMGWLAIVFIAVVVGLVILIDIVWIKQRLVDVGWLRKENKANS